MLRATCNASWRFRSVSFKISLLAPLSKIVQALGSLQFTKKQKYSSPSFLISNKPHLVPISDSCNSSVRLTMVAPQALATRLLSLLRKRLTALMPAFRRKCCARSDTPFSVNTTSGFNAIMSSHWRRTCSSSNSNKRVKSLKKIIRYKMFQHDSKVSYRLSSNFYVCLRFTFLILKTTIE